MKFLRRVINSWFNFALHRRVYSTAYSVLSECLWKKTWQATRAGFEPLLFLSRVMYQFLSFDFLLNINFHYLFCLSHQVLLYDVRSDKPMLVKEHHYGFPIKAVEFHPQAEMVVSTDCKAVRIWDAHTVSWRGVLELAYWPVAIYKRWPIRAPITHYVATEILTRTNENACVFICACLFNDAQYALCIQDACIKRALIYA